MPISIVSQFLLVEGATDVVLTNPEQEAGTGNWVRELRVFGPRPEGVDSGAGPLILTVRLVADIRSDIEITTPQLQV